MNNIETDLNIVMKLQLTQPSEMETGDKQKSGVVKSKNDKLVNPSKDTSMNEKDGVTRTEATTQMDDVDNVQESVGKAGESIQQNGEEPRSEHVIVDTVLQNKTNTHQTFIKKPKVTIKISEGLKKPGDLTIHKTGADKGKQVLTYDEGNLSTTGAISAVPISFMRPMEQGNEVLGKRVSNPTEVLLSPYVKRKVSITTNLQSDEKAITEYMFSGMLPPT